METAKRHIIASKSQCSTKDVALKSYRQRFIIAKLPCARDVILGKLLYHSEPVFSVEEMEIIISMTHGKVVKINWDDIEC